MRDARVLAAVLVATVGLLPAMPAEHVHETEADGHSRMLVHQHAHSHPVGHGPGEHHRPCAVDHPDDPVLTLSAVFTTPTLQPFAAPARLVVAVIQPVHVDVGRASSGFVERVIHGPPRAPSGLRAPPASPA